MGALETSRSLSQSGFALAGWGVGGVGVRPQGADADPPGRQHPDDVTLFDSTGLAIQDLAIAKLAYSKAKELDLQMLDL